MRDPERIEPFLKEVGNIWKKECPDWRFGQLISNLEYKCDPFFMEEDQFLQTMKATLSKINTPQ